MAVMLNCCVAAIFFSITVSIWTTGGSSNLVQSAQCRKKCEHHFKCCTINRSVLGQACLLLCSDKFQTTKQDANVRIFPIKKGALDDLLCDEGNNQPSHNNRSPADEEHTGSGVTPRILIFSQPKRGIRAQTTVYQMILPNLELRHYRYIYLKYPVAAVYVASNQTLVIARSETYTLDSKLAKTKCKLQFFHIDSPKCFHTSAVCVGSNMAVDESQGLLFLPSTFPFRGIMVMTIEEKDLKPIVKIKSKPECITVDESRSRIFLSILGDEDRKIVEYYYNGTAVDDKIITYSIIRSWISFESNTDALYFQIGRKIHMFFPGNASRSVFKSIEYGAVTFHIFKGDIYFILSLSKGYVRVIRENGAKGKMHVKRHGRYDKTTCLVM